MTKEGNPTLVLGASLNADRYANKAIHKLVEKNQTVIAVGLREGVVSGVEIVKDIPETYIDTVTLYVGKEKQKDYYKKIIALKPRRIIFNPGTENPELYKLLDENKINYIEACTLVMLSIDNY